MRGVSDVGKVDLGAIIFLGCMIVITLALGHMAWGWL
jgi:hypothetical protein